MIDSALILELVNELTLIHNQIGKGEMFLAGSNMISLQTRIFNLYENVLEFEGKERNLGEDGYIKK